MNIPCDELYTLLNTALKTADKRRCSARFIFHCGSTYCPAGYSPVVACLVPERWPGISPFPETPLMGHWNSSPSKGICCVAAGTRVAPLAARQLAQDLPAPAVALAGRVSALPAPVPRSTPVLAFTPGTPAINYFPLPLWRRLYDRVLREEGSALLGYGDPAGEPALRAAIARHLALSRGIDCDASQIVITEGALEGVNLCTLLLSEPGDVAGWKIRLCRRKSAFVKAGLAITGIPVDGEGMCWEGTEAPSPSLIFTSPSHQFPYGSVLSARRRLALLDVARQHNARIIEDDYDSEFRYSGEPVPAMLGMINHAPVVYLGTFSKTLFPSLRMGFMVFPGAGESGTPGHRFVIARRASRRAAYRRCSLKRVTMPAIWQPCVVSIVNATGSCVRL